jgi:hypothetical protein
MSFPIDIAVFPRPLSTYPVGPGESVFTTLLHRLRDEPFNGVATSIFLVAILHTFLASRFTKLAHRLQRDADERRRARGLDTEPNVVAELVHFLGEIEVVFGLWGIVLFLAIVGHANFETARHYISETVTYSEALFVVVIMTMASSRPIIHLAESGLGTLARLGRATPLAWWVSILIVGPLFGSLITEPGAMTIAAVLLSRQFYDLQPSVRLKYATLGLLFVNVSIGGTLTHFAAPPVLMVARPWGWGTGFIFSHIGWRAALAIVISTGVYLVVFQRELRGLRARPAVPDVEQPDEEAVGGRLSPVPAWITIVHLGFMAWAVVNAHYPAMFIGGFLFFLGFVRATAMHQSRIELRTPMLVGFFLAGLVIHGGLQAWWIAPFIGAFGRVVLFSGATVLTAFNDNALITYLATLAPALDDHLKLAVLQGAVTGGGMTVIANAPNPAGQALLARFFDDTISPAGLAAAALLPTLIAVAVFLA